VALVVVDALFVIIVVLFIGMPSLLLLWLCGTAMSSYESDESADRDPVIACNPSVEKWLYMEEKGGKKNMGMAA
jgi:hypothetical protein